MLKKAIYLDPNYADSYASLADVYDSYSNFITKTDEEENYYEHLRDSCLAIAFKLDSTSAEVHFVMGYAYWDKLVEYNRAEDYVNYEITKANVIKSFKRALKINSNHDQAYESLGVFSSVAISIHELSIRFLTKSIELNPLNVRSYAWRGKAYYDLGEFDKAEEDYKKQLEIESDHMVALTRYLVLLIAMKRYVEADSLLEKLEKTYPDRDFRGYRILSYASKGEKEKALKTNKDRNGKFSPALCALLGMKEDAMNLLSKESERLFKLNFSRYYRLKTNPFFESIRSDPRFQEILAKHKELYEENLRKYGDIDI
jgi:tetratricopeptide (TPR) repeat protein